MQKKKILFLITKSNWGGAQRYVFDLATHLPQNEFEVVVALGGNVPNGTFPPVRSIAPEQPLPTGRRQAVGGGSGILIEKLEHAGIRVVQIPGLQRDISLKKELYSFWATAQIIRAERPDVLHVNSSKAGGIGAFCGRLLRVPRIIYTAHGWAFNEDRGEVGRFIVGFFHWLTILLSHTTITVSNTLKAQMRWPFTANKMTTIYNGSAEPTHLSREAARAYFIAREPRLAHYADDIWTGSVGELHPVKGHAVMVEAVAKLVAAGNQLRHLIIGEEANCFASSPVRGEAEEQSLSNEVRQTVGGGNVPNGTFPPVRGEAEEQSLSNEVRQTVGGGNVPNGTFPPVRGEAKEQSLSNEVRQTVGGEYTKKLRQQIAALGMTEHIFLIGHHDNASQYLNAFDIYVQPSYSEALGYTVIEAAQAGLPIVASRVGGISEIITHEKNGLLVPQGDPHPLADNISTLLINATQRDTLAHAAQERGGDFSLTNMVEATRAVYEN